MRRACPVALVLTLTVGPHIAPAMGHDIVVRSQPAKNDSVAAGDVTIEIEYSGRIDAPRSRLCLVAPDGGERELRLEDEGRPNVMNSKAADLFPGVYMLRWHVLSSDGHITRGTIPFRVIDR